MHRLRHGLSRRDTCRRNGRTRARRDRRRHRCRQSRQARGRRHPVLRARSAKDVERQPRCWPVALHHRLRRGRRLRRRALLGRRDPAEEGRIRRRPPSCARRDRHPGAAAAPTRGDRRQVNGARRHGRRALGPGPRPCTRGGRRRGGVEPRIPARGLRRLRHAAPRPHCARRATGFDPSRGRDP
jgi:hypothetical protein